MKTTTKYKIPVPFFGAIIKRALKVGSRVQSLRTDTEQLQERTLRRLLRKASNTAFGRHYGFKDILRATDIVTEFQQRVPIHDYNKMHDEWWHRCLESEENVCWPGKVPYFALSSGTSGAPSKFLPETPDMLRSMRRASLRMFFTLAKYNLTTDFFDRDVLLIGSSSTIEDKGDYKVGDLSGINSNHPPFWLKNQYKPGVEVQKIKDWHERIEKIVELAPDWDVAVVVGLPSWVQLMLEKVVAHHKLNTIHDLWPNFQIFVNSGVALAPYLNSFARLTSKPIIYMDSYLASEGFIAFQARPSEINSMALVLNNGIFYEFVPFDDKNFSPEGLPKSDAEVLNIHQVKKNVDYALLLTTNAGTWRYMLGDTVRFTNIERAEIIISGRTTHFLSISGEHLSVNNMNQAIANTQEELNITIKEYTVAAIEKGRFFAHRWFVGCDDASADKDLILKTIDQHLCAINDDYATERTAVLDVEIQLIPSHLFYDYIRHNGKEAQAKVPRVTQKHQLEKWEEFIRLHL
jgi:GH3 auxin-responsive promoter